MSDQKIILVCSRLADGPRLVDAVAACKICGEEVGMSTESRKVYIAHKGEHEIRCGHCQIKLHGPPSDEDMLKIFNEMSDGQRAEVFRLLQEERRRHEHN